MRNSRRSFVTALMILASLILFGGSLVINQHSLAQKPTPKEGTPSGAGAQINEGDKQTCEDLKRQIQDIQDELARLAASIENGSDQIILLDKAISELQKYLDSKSWLSKIITDPEVFRGDLLELKAKRLRLNKQIEQDKELIQAMKDVIADLLNKLGNCGLKPSTATPSPAPTPNPTPTSNPPENKKVALLPDYHVDTKTANGLFVTTFDTPQGKIKVNLTDDLAAGDTISGTVETEPAGKTDAERAQNQAELNGYVIELEGQKTTVGDKKITCNIPTTLTTDAKTIVLQFNGQTVATTEIPISAQPFMQRYRDVTPPSPMQVPGAPHSFDLPTGGQQGKPIRIKGPCDGVFAPNDSVKIGPTILPPVAESPRSLVVLNTSDVPGPTSIYCNENGVATQCPFRNIGIKLSAPKLNLQRGETTTLHVLVSGLAGMTQDLPLDLVNNSPTVISMSGGDNQHFTIHPADVQQDGTSAMDRTLTGKMAGGFVVTGTVIWADVCKRP